MQEQYDAFYDDVIPEFEKFGKILQFKVYLFLVLENKTRHAIIWFLI